MNLLMTLCSMLILITSTSAAVDEQRSWLGLFSKKPILEKNYSIWQEIQFRYDHENGEMGQLLTRFGLLKPINEHHEMGLIMAYIATGSSKEYRPTLQHLYSKTTEVFFYSFRSRLEWRDLENNASNSIRLRLSPNLRWNFKENMAFAIWDEAFLNLTREEWTGKRAFERNRLFAGIRHSFPDLVFEYGYLNQYIPRKNRDIVEHTLVLNFYY